MKARPAPRLPEAIVPMVAGPAFCLGAVLLGGADWGLPSLPLVAFRVAFLLVGGGIFAFGARNLLDIVLATRGAVPIAATVLEVRRDVTANGHVRRARWTVIAEGQWPDGQSCEFRSSALLKDPRGGVAPGQTVQVRGNPASRLYAMDLATVSGDAAEPAAFRPWLEGRSAARHSANPAFGLAIGAAAVALGAFIAIATGSRGNGAAMGLVTAAFGLLVFGLSHLAKRSARRLAALGVSFPVKVVQITHVRSQGVHPSDHWAVAAEGAWPDGFRQQFRGAASSLGALREGATIWVRGDPSTRIYELHF